MNNLCLFRGLSPSLLQQITSGVFTLVCFCFKTENDIHTLLDVGAGCLLPGDCRNFCCLEAQQSV